MTDGPYTTITVEEYNRLMEIVRMAEASVRRLAVLQVALEGLHRANEDNHDQGGDRSEGGMRDGL